MAKVTEYPRITKMKDNDILLVDGPDGTRTILQTNASKQMGGEVIMVNETAGDSTKVVINTTDEDIELATMVDLEPVEEDVSALKTQLDNYSENIAQSAVELQGIYIKTNKQIATVDTGNRTVRILGEPNTTYKIQKATATIMRAGVLNTDAPAVDTYVYNYTAHTTASNAPLYITTTTDKRYIFIQLFSDADSSDLKSISVNLKTLNVSEYAHGITSKNSIENEILNGKVNVLAPSWTFGYYNANGYGAPSSSTYKRSDMLPAGKYTITPESGFQFLAFKYKNDGEGIAIVDTSSSAAAEFYTENPLIVTFKKQDGSNISAMTDAEVNESITIAYEPILYTLHDLEEHMDPLLNPVPAKIRIMQYNVGKFNKGLALDGATQFLTVDNYEDVILNYKRVFGAVSADFMGIEEYEDARDVYDSTGTTVETTVSFESSVFARLYPYKKERLNVDSKKSFKSKYPIADGRIKELPIEYTYDGQTYNTTLTGIYTHVNIAGRNVMFVTINFKAGRNEQTHALRVASIQAVINELADEEYAFIICDSNLGGTTVGDGGIGPSIAEGNEVYNTVLAPNGWTNSMGSYFPWEMTCQNNNKLQSSAIDQIFYKNNGKILLNNFTVLADERNNLASDHVPVYGDYLLY